MSSNNEPHRAYAEGGGGYLREMADEGYNADSIGAFHLKMVPWVIHECGVKKDDLIVDVGSGQGHCVISAQKGGYTNLAAVDIDPLNFELFQERHRIRCYRANVENDVLPFPDSTVGLITCMHLIEHLRDPQRFLTESHRVLRNGGTIALVTPDWRKQYKRFWRDPTHVHPYDHESIARLLRMNGFSEVRTSPWGSAYGLGRLGIYGRFPRLGLIGADLLAIGVK